MTIELGVFQGGVVANFGDVAVALAGSPVTGSTERRHSGLLVHSSMNGPVLLHLAFHNKLYLNPPPFDEYGYIKIAGVHPLRMRSLAGWLIQLYHANQEAGIPYGFDDYADVTLSDEGMHLVVGDGKGLTCSGFVLAALKAFGINLINQIDWPIGREMDSRHINEILDMFYRPNGEVARGEVGVDYVEGQRNLLLGVVKRFRAEEVAAAAAIHDGRPKPYLEIGPVSERLLSQLVEHGLI